MDTEERSLFEHKHDDWRGYLGTSEPNTWLDVSKPSLKNPDEIIPCMMTLVNPDSHLHRAVESNLSVHQPGYDVRYVYYHYYPDLLEQGEHRVAGLTVEIEDRHLDYDEPGYEDSLYSVEYMVEITNLSGFTPLGVFNDDGRMKEAYAERLAEVVKCPDCMYYRMLHEGMLQYLEGREQTQRDVMEAEEAEEEAT